MLGILHNSETQHTHFDKYSKYEKYDNYKISIDRNIYFFKEEIKKRPGFIILAVLAMQASR